MTGTGAEGKQQGYEIFLKIFAGVSNFLESFYWGMKLKFILISIFLNVKIK